MTHIEGKSDFQAKLNLLRNDLYQSFIEDQQLSCTSIQSSIPFTPSATSVAQKQNEGFYEKHFALLESLHIDKDACISVPKRTLTFNENRPRYRLNEKKYQIMTGKEEFEFYEFGADSEKTNTWLFFSHGGKIHPDVIGTSAYLPILSTQLPDIKLIGVNHRGSKSEQDMCRYSLTDRITDIYLVLYYLISTGKIKSNDLIISFGDSMGGHVASTATQIPELFDALILTEPAAYTKKAQTLPFKELGIFDAKVPVSPTTFTTTIRNNAPTDSYALECVQNFCMKNKDILLSFVELDGILNVGQYFAPHLYWDAITQSTNKEQKAIRSRVSYSGKHGDTTLLEIEAIKNFISQVKTKHEAIAN